MSTAVGTARLDTLPPSSAEGDPMQDLIAAVFRVLNESAAVQNTSAENGVRLNKTMRDAQEALLREAEARAKDDAENGGIFNALTKDIGLLGVVGLATFNYQLVAADVALHATGVVKNLKLDAVDAASAALVQTHPEILAADLLLRKTELTPDAVKKVLNDLHLGTDVPGISDEDVKPIVKTALEVNLLIAGAAVTVLSAGTTTALVVALVAVALSAGAYAAQKADAPPWLVIGMSVAGAALSCGGGMANNTGTVLRAGSEIAAAKAVAAGINGANAAMRGTDTIIHTVAQNRIDNANLDAKAARVQLAKLQRILDDLLDALRETQSSSQRTKSCAENTLDTYNQTLISTSNTLRA